MAKYLASTTKMENPFISIHKPEKGRSHSDQSSINPSAFDYLYDVGSILHGNHPALNMRRLRVRAGDNELAIGIPHGLGMFP